MIHESLFADRTRNMGSSAIREILKVISQPGMISLAGGLPAPEAFPMELMHTLTEKVFSKYGSRALQYDATEGFAPLRKALTAYLVQLGIQVSEDEIIITSGSQGVLDSLGKIFISPNDKIAVEAPTYLGAIQAFNPYQPEYIQMETDEEGVIPSSMESVIEKNKLKFIYLVPTFQNPTGRTLTENRRKEIAGIIIRHNTLLIEDDPYSALRYRGKQMPTIKQFAPDNVVYAGTFSKTFVPGLRVGFTTAPEPVKKWLVLAKQGVDLHTSTFNQALAAEYLEGGHIERHVPKIIDLYRPKQEAMLEAMEEHFPSSFSWTKPEGGMFIWAEGPDGCDVMPIYEEALKEKVAIVPGRFFYTRKEEGLGTMRLNFTMADIPTIHSAIGKLGKAIKRAL